MSATKTTIAELTIAADPECWRQAGLAVEGDTTRVGSTGIRFVEPASDSGGGLLGWTLADASADAWDGLSTELALDPEPQPRLEHPVSAVHVDHVVVFTSSLERTSTAFEANGVRCRRIREVGPPERQLRQAFFRFGEVIAEVVEVGAEQAGPEGTARFWGLTLAVADLDRAATELGPKLGTVRDAVQPGRRIATVRKDAGLGLPVALITLEQRAGPAAPGAGE